MRKIINLNLLDSTDIIQFKKKLKDEKVSVITEVKNGYGDNSKNTYYVYF